MEPDLTDYERAPLIEDPSVNCDWCGTPGDEEQGGVRDYGSSGKMHAGCAWSSENGGLATALKRNG